ncbi:MAG: iron-containing alcohol dehydrogenase [Spirochaetia bacterium]|jgi:alcohol dehydrogenase class IV|nr:iron-containing alcohol dehydrogenase [Spirochaetia bacterium]
MNSFIQVPSRLYYGQGCLESVKESIARTGAKKILVCTDKELRKLGMTALFEKYAAQAGASCAVVDEILPEPSAAGVEKTLGCVAASDMDMIAAIGGGSVMDTAKLLSVLVGAPYTVRDLLRDPGLARKKYTTLMVPTTCGTGSEATGNAILAIPEEQTKKGIVNPCMISDEVILDADMIAKLPGKIVAATGVDALAHCVECYTGKKATPLSDLYAAQGARLIFHNLEKAYNTPGDTAARQNLLLGAFYGGAAIAGSGTTAVHALAYPLGGRYHVAHGVSNAILFAQVMAFNRDACEGRLAGLCDVVYPELAGKRGPEKADTIIRRIAEIVKNTEIPVSLKEFGVKEEDLEDLVVAGSAQKRLLSNNMKEMSLDDIRSIYRQVL